MAAYGTILVDLKRGKVADLSPVSSAVAVEQWLQQHPGMKIISRDVRGHWRKDAGVVRPRPNAKQVADRFHPIQNLQQAVQTELLCPAGSSKDPAVRLAKQEFKIPKSGLGGGGKRSEHVWSNGPVEGHTNRLLTLKRQMYGRAKFELLGARALPLAA